MILLKNSIDGTKTLENTGDDNMNKTRMIIKTTKQLLQAAIGLLGLLILMAVMKAFLIQNLHQHPVITAGLLSLFTLSIYVGSKERRDALVHFVSQALHLEQLLMDDPEEEQLMNKREQKLGEAGSMDLWR